MATPAYPWAQIVDGREFVMGTLLWAFVHTYFGRG
jgi:hypothetical protein